MARCPEEARALLEWAGEHHEIKDKEAAIRTLLTERAAEAVACADASSFLRNAAVRALVTLDEKIEARPEWMVAIKRWTRAPDPYDLLLHLFATTGSSQALPVLKRSLKRYPSLYLSLAYLPGPASRITIEKGLGSKKAEIRAYAAAALAKHGPDACSALLGATSKEKDPRTLGMLFFTLGYLHCVGAPALALAHIADADPAVRDGAVSVLGRFPDPAHIPVLLKLVRDRDSQVAQGAATALFRQPPELSWVKVLVAAATKLQRPRLMAVAIDRASALGTPELLSSTQALVASKAANADAETLSAALTATSSGFPLLPLARVQYLALHGNQPNLKVCEAEVDCMPVAIEAALALVRIPDRSTVEVLTTMLDQASEPETGAAALLALWSLDERRAVDFLHKHPNSNLGNHAAVFEAARSKRVPSDEKNGLQAQIRILDAEVRRSRAEIEVWLPPEAPIPASVDVSVFLKVGTVELPIQHKVHEAKAQHTTLDHSLTDLLEFELALPLSIRVSANGKTTILAIPALGSLGSVRIVNDSGSFLVGTLVRLASRKEVMESIADIAGDCKIYGITPGPMTVEYPDDMPEADPYTPGEDAPEAPQAP